MKFSKIAILAACALAGAAAHAGPNVQWSVTIGVPGIPVPVVAAPYPAYPVYGPPVVVAPAPRYYEPRVVYVPQYPQYRERRHDSRRYARRDDDGDGVPNRWDRVYNPRWDVDGDGVPNRYDRHDRNPYRR